MRLVCIDAPEMAQQPHGQRAREYLQMWLPVGAQVRLDVTTTDRFGRTATELIGGINLGLALVDTICGSTVGAMMPRTRLNAVLSASRQLVRDFIGDSPTTSWNRAVLLVACWWGSGLLELFGISLQAFRSAGGLMLLPLGLRLLEGQPALQGSALADDPGGAIVPIGMTLMAGPSTISLVIAEAPDAWTGRLLVSLVICAMAMGLYLFLQLTPRLRGWLGQTRERVLQRLMGLLITAVAVQILVNGLKGCFQVLA